MRATSLYRELKLQGKHGFELTTKLILDSRSLYVVLVGLFRSDENSLSSVTDNSTIISVMLKKTHKGKIRERIKNDVNG